MLAGLSVALPVWTGRAVYPRIERQAAEHSLAAARGQAADRWAPETFAAAESTFRAAVDEGVRQRVRIIPFQNFAATAQGFRQADETARRAESEGLEARSTTAAQASEALDRAADAVDHAERTVRIVPVGPAPRTGLQRARALLAEARALDRNREHDRALEKAEASEDEALRVLDQSRSMASRYLDAGTVRQWQRWIEDTIAESRAKGIAALIVFKEKNRVDLYHSGRRIKSYDADMGRNRLSRKLVAGDKATPEGRYAIRTKKGRGNSKYYMALELNYPNETDRKRLAQAKDSGQAAGRAGPGSLIEIHGEGGRGEDWTLGCVALSNRDMDDLFSRVAVGTPVTIVGGDGQDGKFSDLARRLSGPPR